MNWVQSSLVLLSSCRHHCRVVDGDQSASAGLFVHWAGPATYLVTEQRQADPNGSLGWADCRHW